MRRIFALFPALVMAACSAATAPALPPARAVGSVTVNGVARSYILRLPKVYDGKTRLPLVMVLHGATDSAAYAEKAYHVDEKAEAQGYVLVLPDALGEAHVWSSTGTGDGAKDDLAFLTGLLETLPRTYAIDEKRMYVGGHSAGAIMTYRLAVERPDLIAAVGIVAGLVYNFDQPKAPMPIIAFHGKKDDTLPFYEMADALAFWAKANHSAEKPLKSEKLPKGVTRDTFVPTDGKGAEMVAYSLDNGNHMWPGGNIMPGKSIEPVQDISATDVMFEFFKGHGKK